MHFAEIKSCDIANGPGVRVSLFVSGCTHRCKGCFNAIAWDFAYGEEFTEQTVEHLMQLLRPAHIKGITILGGEPFEPQNQEPVLRFCSGSARNCRRKASGLFQDTCSTGISSPAIWAIRRSPVHICSAWMYLWTGRLLKKRKIFRCVSAARKISG